MTDKILVSRRVIEKALKALEKADRISGYRNNRAEILALRSALDTPQGEPPEFYEWWEMRPSLTRLQAYLLWKESLCSSPTTTSTTNSKT